MAVAPTNIAASGLVTKYLATVAKVLKTKAATDETSHYPALNTLLSDLGGISKPRRGALSSPKGIGGDFPDVAVYELRSNVLVLPVEAKGPASDIAKLARSAQARRYAQSFGGGRVLVTNIRSFAVSEIDPVSGKLVMRDSVDLVAQEDDLKKPSPAVLPNAAERLAAMVEAACAVRGTIQKPQAVAKLLAYHGRLMTDAIQNTGKADELLAPIKGSFVEGLDMHLDDDLLVPTTVQTLLYGLFAAWLDDDDPQNFEWIGASYGLSLPVYADMIHSILTPKFVRNCNLPAFLEAAARMLSWVDRDEFERAFEGGAIEYFYEPFLAEFDGHLRNKLGVWYTPRAVADYQVARVDHHLRHDLAVSAGLASTTDDVLVLDPACGTGTYIASTLRLIRQYHLDQGQPALVASQRAAEAARDRVVGFELLPAAFVIAHININRLLRSWNVPFADGERARIYLTNSLTGWESGAQAPTMPLMDLELEIRAALEVKGQEPVIAILGNPPYEGFSAAESKSEKELLKPWMETLHSEYGVRKHRLGDLYVRFWRIAIQKIAVLTDRGVISYISNSKWLGGRSFPLMRENLCLEFNEIVVDDLHGGVHEGIPGDESIFKTKTAVGIRIGAAIVTAIRFDGDLVSVAAPAKVSRRDLTGAAKAKHAQLQEWADAGDKTDAMQKGLSNVIVSRGKRWRLSAPTSADAPALDEYLPSFFSGVQPVRDEAVLDREKASLTQRMKDYFDPQLSNSTLVSRHRAFGVKRSGYNVNKTRDALLKDKAVFDSSKLVRYAFKPFAHRWMYWETERGLLHRPRPDLKIHWDSTPDQCAIVVPQTARRPGAARPFTSRAVPAFASVDPDARVFPRMIRPAAPFDTAGTLFEDEQEGGVEATPPTPVTAVAPDWIHAARTAGLTGTDDSIGDSIFFALIALMHSPAWIGSQPDQLDDFPSVPLPANPAQILAAAQLGQKITDLWDIDRPVPGVDKGVIPPALANVGVPAHYGSATLLLGKRSKNGGFYDAETKTLLWDDSPKAGWTGVSQEIWDFSVGGFPVLAKHLSYGVGEALSTQDREIVMSMCRRIAVLLELEGQCDSLFTAANSSPLEIVVAADVPVVVPTVS